MAAIFSMERSVWSSRSFALRILASRRSAEKDMPVFSGSSLERYGYPMPGLMVATYNDDGSVNVMNLHEATRTVEGDMALFSF